MYSSMGGDTGGVWSLVEAIVTKTNNQKDSTLLCKVNNLT